MRTTLICMMAKAPEPGRVKTRLELPPEVAANLATAFIDDTWRAIDQVSGARRALAFAGSEARLPQCVAGAERWAQVGADLGARIEHTIRRGLDAADLVVVTGSDAPALPPALMRAAAAGLETNDAMIGPAIDGGYYLIAMTRCDPGLFDHLPWSQANTRAKTVDRLIARGYSVGLLPPWFDVDDRRGLDLLRHAITAGFVDAPATALALRSLAC